MQGETRAGGLRQEGWGGGGGGGGARGSKAGRGSTRLELGMEETVLGLRGLSACRD